MNSQMTEIEAKDLLDKVARKSKAKRYLASSNSYSILSLVSSILGGFAAYVMADSTLSMTVKILITIGFVFGVIGSIDSWRLHRRLDAAIELLLQVEDEHSKLGK